jgi:hypothetical protein
VGNFSLAGMITGWLHSDRRPVKKSIGEKLLENCVNYCRRGFF